MNDADEQPDRGPAIHPAAFARSSTCATPTDRSARSSSCIWRYVRGAANVLPRTAIAALFRKSRRGFRAIAAVERRMAGHHGFRSTPKKSARRWLRRSRRLGRGVLTRAFLERLDQSAKTARPA
jgi:hypothetical protein